MSGNRIAEVAEEMKRVFNAAAAAGDPWIAAAGHCLKRERLAVENVLALFTEAMNEVSKQMGGEQ